MRINRVMIVFAFAFGSLLSVGCGAASSTSKASVRPDAVTRCVTAHLSVRVGNWSGAAGTDLFPLVFKNKYTVACKLQGYPGVSFVDAHGVQIAHAAVREGSRPGPWITVAPRRSSTAYVVYSSSAALSCTNAVHVTDFRVYPPNQKVSTLAPITDAMCRNAPRDSLMVYQFGARRPQI
jgi:hypothetical protein